MDLNAINLPVSEVADLYKNSLVIINSHQINGAAKDEGPEWDFFGQNKKNVLVAVRYPEVKYIPDKQLTFLTKLLSACNYSLADVAIINFHFYQSQDFNDLISTLSPTSALLFGIEASEFGLPMNFPQFQVQNFRNIKFLISPTLETIEPEKTLKSNLWVALKKMYNL